MVLKDSRKNRFLLKSSHFKKLFILLPLIALAKCGPVGVQKPEEIIHTLKFELSKNKKDLNYINRWSRKQHYAKPFYLQVNRSDVLGEVYYNDFSHRIENEQFSNYLVDFIYSTDFIQISVHENFIAYEYSERNEFLHSYYLVYFKNNPTGSNYLDYKLYKNGGTQKEAGGWLYHLKENWYIKSLPERDKLKDSIELEEKRKIIHLANFNQSFSGRIISKTKLNNNQFIIKLILNKSTINYFEPRDSIQYFFCLIDYSIAEILYNEEFQTSHIGDACYFNDGFSKNTCLLKQGDETIYCTATEMINYEHFKHKN